MELLNGYDVRVKGGLENMKLQNAGSLSTKLYFPTTILITEITDKICLPFAAHCEDFSPATLAWILIPLNTTCLLLKFLSFYA